MNWRLLLLLAMTKKIHGSLVWCILLMEYCIHTIPTPRSTCIYSLWLSMRRIFLNTLLLRSPLRGHFLEWTRTWSTSEAFTWRALRREMRRKIEIPNTLPKPSARCMVMQSACNIGLMKWVSSLAASMQHVLVWRLQECYLGLQIWWFSRTISLRILKGKKLVFLCILFFFPSIFKFIMLFDKYQYRSIFIERYQYLFDTFW